MGLFGRRNATPSTPVASGVAAPGSPAERVEALTSELRSRGIGGVAAQGHPVPVGEVGGVVRAFLPDAGERRALCRRLAEDLESMIVVDAVDADEVLDVLGATSARLAEHAVPRRTGADVRGAADAALALAHELRLGEGDHLDRWARDDGFVVDALAVLVVAFTRLAV